MSPDRPYSNRSRNVYVFQSILVRSETRNSTKRNFFYKYPFLNIA